ncbi:hypothetical protein XELAEV_18026856mg [Xenopus laevis]|uniref:Uncharacterized protein n=1 Tax=Xenopus laevis TaxID=8355 RepID=A0A974CV48_XENLA|nr:hypothetical protein XELAEV_18026856mg [Xenopus laevis]
MAAKSKKDLIGHKVLLYKGPNHEIKPFASLSVLELFTTIFNFPSIMVKSSTCNPPCFILDGETTSLTRNAAKKAIMNTALNNIHS